MKEEYLKKSITCLTEIDAKRFSLFKKLIDGESIFKLIALLPSNVWKRHLMETPTHKYAEHLVTFSFDVISHVRGLRRGAPYRIKGVCTQSQVEIDLLFFNAYEKFLKRVAYPGTTIAVSGKLQIRTVGNKQTFQLTHPDHMGPIDTLQNWVCIESIYPLVAGLIQSMVRNAIRKVMCDLPQLPEWLSKPTLELLKFQTWNEAMHAVHDPKSFVDISPMAMHRQRLAFDELFAKQLSQHYHAYHALKQYKAPVLSGNRSQLLENFLSSLPFKLTNDQLQAIQDIHHDMQQETPMHRLVQGDVGSGKTLVSFAAALIAIENGHQAAILAPTDILVRQHLATVERFLKPLNIKFCLLTGREKGLTRKKILQGIADNEIQLIVGTHAIFQKDVEYNSLALAVIDEQHRFGVKQRFALASKSEKTHILSMTATPIPRTLMLAHYGEMTVSQIKEKPPGRRPIDTRTVSVERMPEVVDFISKRIAKGEKIFWVCPLVEESQKLDLAAATIRYDFLKDIFGNTVVLTHGQLKGDEKEAGLNSFAHGDAQLLVATTVIEVGVDVPKATVMIIEHAERFGLAQLHQLRGRIGRGDLDGVCLLMFGENLSFTAKKRLEMMKKTEDGFVLAEEDLRLRGGGDTLGLRQSGMPKFTFAVFQTDDDIVNRRYESLYEKADSEARQLILEDPELISERGRAAQYLMSLFECDEAERFKKTG